MILLRGCHRPPVYPPCPVIPLTTSINIYIACTCTCACSATTPVSVAVTGEDGAGTAVSYKLDAEVTLWTGGGDIHPNTPPAPEHGNYVWRSQLKPSSAGTEHGARSTEHPTQC